MPEIYQPAEDSLFLSDFLKKEISDIKKDLEIKKIKFLDVGSGSGIQTECAFNSGIVPKNITVLDINKAATRLLKKRFPKSKVVFSDLFSNVNGKYDLIVFNPPYLPETKFDKKPDTSGGKNGSEIINKFLEQAKNYLSERGIILVLTSSFTKKINWNGYKKKLLGKKRIFFEEIYVWKLSKN